MAVEQEADLAVRELERTNAFDRAVLAVGTTTGTGWINENTADSLEYIYNGDTAIVSLQYSYLPSWISFIVDKARAQEAGRSLFDAVYAHWLTLPAEHRPKLVVFGESLGSFGSEAAFSGPQDLATRTSGALFVGPPSSNVLWGRITRGRDSGSPRVAAGLSAGRHRAIRVAGERPRLTEHTLERPAGHLPSARVGSDRLVVAGPAVPEAGLAAREARARRPVPDPMDPADHVPAGERRHGRRRRGASRDMGTATAPRSPTAGWRSSSPRAGRQRRRCAWTGLWRRLRSRTPLDE